MSSPPDARDLLAWYDHQRRDLPWRAKPGETPDPYRVWLSEIMLQQTTVQAVKPYFARFLARFPTVEALAAAPSDAVMQAWAGLGYYSRARNLHACARTIVDRHGGRFPGTEADLRALPGIGPYTAGAVAAIAFDQPAVAVDGNVERVMSRLFMIEAPLPGARPVVTAHATALLPPDRPGDYAQALMDLGATVCTPRNPVCALCPWRGPCRARAAGTMESFPRKAPKKAGETRKGLAFVAVHDNAVLLRTRPPRGLLGGMAETPTSTWRAGPLPAAASEQPFVAGWRTANAPVRHVFTHFALELAVLAVDLKDRPTVADELRWTPLPELGREPLSTVMEKVLAVGLQTLGLTTPAFRRPSKP